MIGDLVRPDLPRPGCRVMLICGPVASGKSTYVRDHAAPDDIVIDFDLIANEMFGCGYDREWIDVGEVLEERNRRFELLADEPPARVAWVILTAPSKRLRCWWCDVLNVRPDDLVLLVPSTAELRRRIMLDPSRKSVRRTHLELVDRWFDKERRNNPGVYKSGVSADGWPTDPLHSWNH